MSVEENKAIIRRLMEEQFNQNSMTIITELYAEQLAGHAPYPLPGASIREALQQFQLQAIAQAAQRHVTIEDLVAEADKVAMRFNMTFAHTAEYLGVPPTGKQVTETGITIFRLANGQIVEFWNQPDLLGLLQQPGALPAPGQGSIP